MIESFTNNSISILDIVHDTTVDGPGFRTAIYAAGCLHHCKGCHNPESWTMKSGKLLPIDYILREVKEFEFANVTFTGGDPFMQINPFTALAKLIKRETAKNIWCYTGYRYEDIVKSSVLSQILPYIDVLVDGKYMETLRNESLKFRGSSNQRIINVQETINRGEIVLWNS